MKMPGFTAESSLGRTTGSYTSSSFATLGFSGKQVSAAVLVCVDGDCSFFGGGGGGRGGGLCLTPQEARDCRINCAKNCRSSSCLDDCLSVCTPVC